ncbi:MAG: nickel-dependent hydrogenase large subunit, partial [Acetobacter sp.]|nr:nickel-dependent hydrogenase large subunit [Acetobacter sp.]
MTVFQTPNGFTLDNSGRRVVVDPITRIEGHLRVEVNVDQQNVIRNAVSTGAMWRGLEVILRGRDPRDAWAFVERICGVCTGCHALASVRAVEDTLGIRVATNAFLIRQIMAKVLAWQDHLVHFYHLHALDWVNPLSALKADPRATSQLQQTVSPDHPKSSPGYFRDVQNRLRKFVESGQLGIFKNGYWNNAAYLLPPEANLMAVTHYLEALDFQREIVKVHAIFGGKNPHPNYLVGGVPCAINIDGDMAAGAPVNMERLNFVLLKLQEAFTFSKNVYVPDVIAIASFYKNWLYGGGLSAHNVMAYGDYPTVQGDPSTDRLPGGVILNGNWNEIHPINPRDPAQVQEFVTHSWYQYGPGQEYTGLHPWDGITDPHYALGPNAKGTRTNILEVDENAKYSWIKAPRWRGNACEVGPLARYILAYNKGVAYVKAQVDDALDRFNHMAGTNLTPRQALPTTIGRTLARALEAHYCAYQMLDDYNALITNIKNGDTATANMTKWDPATWPKEAKGVGLVEAPRGALGHWVKIRDGRIENYQCVVP